VYSLWEIPENSYARVVDTVGSLSENRADLALESERFVRGPMPRAGRYLTVGYEGARAAPPTDTGSVPLGSSPGTILTETDAPGSGSFRMQVELSRRAVVVLSETYDPGWHAFVDGRPVKTEMVAPALVGVTVGPGEHTVSFEYVGYAEYGLLFAAGGAVLVAGAAWPLILAVRRGRKRTSSLPDDPLTRIEPATGPASADLAGAVRDSG
jgi:hypothetical protein